MVVGVFLFFGWLLFVCAFSFVCHLSPAVSLNSQPALFFSASVTLSINPPLH